MQDIYKKYPDGLPQLDPVTDMGIQDAGVLSAIQQMNELEQQLAKNPGEGKLQCQQASTGSLFECLARPAAHEEGACSLAL